MARAANLAVSNVGGEKELLAVGTLPVALGTKGSNEPKPTLLLPAGVPNVAPPPKGSLGAKGSGVPSGAKGFASTTGLNGSVRNGSGVDTTAGTAGMARLATVVGFGGVVTGEAVVADHEESADAAGGGAVGVEPTKLACQSG